MLSLTAFMHRFFILTVFPVIFLISSCSRTEEISDPEIALNQNWDRYDKYLSSNPDSALFYSREIIRIAKISSKPAWLASASEAVAHLQYQRGFLGDAAFDYFEAAKLYTELGSLQKLANVYNSLGAIYSVAEDYQGSISYYQKASDIWQYEGTAEKKALVALNMAICYKELEQYDNAHDYLEEAMKFALEAKDLDLISSISNNQGIVFSNQGRHEKAIEMYFASLVGADSLAEFKEIQATAFNNIGKAYLDEGNLREAEQFLLKAFALKKEIGNPFFTQSTVNLLAKIAIEKGRYIQAIELLDERLSRIDLSIVDDETASGLSLIIQTLLRAADIQRNSDRAFLIERLKFYSDKLVIYNGNLAVTRGKVEGTSKRQSLQLAEEKYSLGQELDEEQKSNKGMKFAFIVPLLFLLCALVSVYYAFRKKQKMEKMLKAIDQVVNRGVLRR